MADTESEHTNRSNRDEKYSPVQLAIISTCIAISYLVTTPSIYKYAVGNQASQLPLVKHAMDPSYLVNDWVVSLRTGITAPKYYYTQTVAFISELIGLPVAVFILYATSLITIIVGIWIFIDEIFNDKLAATITVGLFLSHLATVPIIIYPPDLGGNHLIQDYLLPSHVANAFIITGLIYSIKTYYRRAFTLFGVATLFHVVNAFWVSLTVGLCIVAVEAGYEIKSKEYLSAIRKIPWDAAAIYGIISSFIVIPLLISRQSSDVGFEAAYITAWVRHPHHYILSQWPIKKTVATVLFIATSVVLLYRFRDRLFRDNRKQIFSFTYVVSFLTILFFGGYVFTEVLPVDTIIQLFPYRIDDFLYIILYGAVAKLTVVSLYKIGTRTSYHPINFSIGLICVILLIGVIGWSGGLALAQSGAEIGVISGDFAGPDKTLSEIYIETPSGEDELEMAYDWIESETPRDAIFLAPPSQSRFRLGSSRARVVNFKAFPFGSESAVEWEKRMNAVCNYEIRRFGKKGFNIPDQCDERFNNMTQAEITRVAETYNATWILTKNSNYDFEHRHSIGEYHIYRIG